MNAMHLSWRVVSSGRLLSTHRVKQCKIVSSLAVGVPERSESGCFLKPAPWVPPQKARAAPVCVCACIVPAITCCACACAFVAGA